MEHTIYCVTSCISAAMCVICRVDLLHKLYLEMFCLQTSAGDVYEVAIVGAGPAGATCGYFLGKVISIISYVHGTVDRLYFPA
jgi:hypothetical protein